MRQRLHYKMIVILSTRRLAGVHFLAFLDFLYLFLYDERPHILALDRRRAPSENITSLFLHPLVGLDEVSEHLCASSSDDASVDV